MENFNAQEKSFKEKTLFTEEDLPPQLLNILESFEEGEDINITEKHIQEYHEWMESILDREKAYGKVWKHMDRQNKKLLSPLQINNHGREHVNRVAGLTGLLYLALRGVQKFTNMKDEPVVERDKTAHHIIRSLLTVAEPAGQMHDIGYSMHLKGKSVSAIHKILSSTAQRGVLPNHAEYGASLAKHGLEKIYKTPSMYQQFFKEKYAEILLWNGDKYHDSLNQCVRAIQKHTSEQLKNPLTVQQTSGDLPLLVYCTDKMDFQHRAPDTIDPAKLFEEGPQIHQRLNLSIFDQDIEVSQKNRHITLILKVDPQISLNLAKDNGVAGCKYTSKKFEKEFFQTYEKSFEEIETIFKVLFTKNIVFDKEDLYHSTFSVKLCFPDEERGPKIFFGRRDELGKEELANEVATSFLKNMNLNES